LLTQINQTKEKSTFSSINVGCNGEPYRAFWALDVPPIDFFKNYCLLLCTILALAQHDYFDSNLNNKKFKYMEKIISSNKKKVNMLRYY